MREVPTARVNGVGSASRARTPPMFDCTNPNWYVAPARATMRNRAVGPDSVRVSTIPEEIAMICGRTLVSVFVVK